VRREREAKRRTSDVVTSSDNDGAVFLGDDEPARREVEGSGEKGGGGSKVGDKEIGMT